MKIISIVGARPQFIKTAPVSRALQAAGIDEFLIHTGQHYDDDMSRIFFDELNLRAPDVNLEIGSGSHAWQTGQMIMGLEVYIQRESPAWVIVYGDTNSTLAGALAAAKLNIPLAHVEAGLRSFNRSMPEEVNRVVADHCADLLFCPTQTAVANLKREGIESGVHRVGDVMFDAVLLFSDATNQHSAILTENGVTPGEYYLATLHRPQNSDNPKRLQAILIALAQLDLPVLIPLHPRTSLRIGEMGWGDIPASTKNLRLMPPVGYLEMLALEKNARLILTDSGGVQREAYILGVPCITLRSETEWVETVQNGWNRLVDVEFPAPELFTERLTNASQADWPRSSPPPVFGAGDAARQIARIILDEQFPDRSS